jgi:hypothetical protein
MLNFLATSPLRFGVGNSSANHIRVLPQRTRQLLFSLTDFNLHCLSSGTVSFSTAIGIAPVDASHYPKSELPP